MKARPILFSGPMVRALLEGQKTQTRRVVRPQPEGHHWGCMPPMAGYTAGYRNLHSDIWQFEHRIDANPRPDCDPWIRCPYGQPGDLLWVRETWADLRGGGFCVPFGYAASTDSRGDEVRREYGVKWKPSIHMPRAASRLTLRITDVRAQRLTDIDGIDAIAEGITRQEGVAPWRSYMRLWNQINGEGAWEANPWVWAITFEVIKQNVDDVTFREAA